MKRTLAVGIFLFGVFLKDVYAEDIGTESNPFLLYVKKDSEASLDCGFQFDKLRWQKKVNMPEEWTLIADGAASPNPDKYKVPAAINGVYNSIHVLNTQPDDELLYRCISQSERYFIQLILYVPPSNLSFQGSTNNRLLGKEGTDLQIICVAKGGSPPPDLSILNFTSSVRVLEVSYTITKISRDYHQKSIVCQATSDALNNPMTTTVQIYLDLKPLTPIFNTLKVSTEETVPLRVSCISYGSLPAATFTWSIGGNDVTSSSTSKTDTAANDTKTVTSDLEASVNRSHDGENIVCQATNTVNSSVAMNILDIEYSPDITVNSATYTENDDTRTVTCNPHGNPDIYIYHKWQHKSKYGELIRMLDGNKTLKLPDVPVRLRYQDGGEYVCIASNGIKSSDNQFNQTGSGFVKVNATPVFTFDTINRVKQFGEIDKAVDIYFNVYSVPKFTTVKWAIDGKQMITQNSKYQTSSSPTIVEDKIHGKEAQLDGYNVTLTIRDLKAEDFTNYTVTLTNRFGYVVNTIMLESASVPETPGNFSQITSSATSITVQWDPNSGGGYKQTFHLQYRVQGSLDWIIKTAGEEDIDEQRRRRTYEVKNLQGGTAYELRMFAENTAMKRSNFTDVLIELTRSSDAATSTGAIIGGVAGSLIGLIIVLLTIVCVLKKRKESANPNMKLRTSSEAEEDDGLKDNILYESSQSDGLKKNILYQSAGPDFESQKTSCEYAVVQKPNAIYAEVNKDPQPKKTKAKKQKDQKEKPKKAREVKAKVLYSSLPAIEITLNNNPEEEYANSALPLQTLNGGEYANSTDTQGPSGHHTNAQGLEYADLTFRQMPGKNKKQVIHGNDERTLYADVDHTKKAPPPPPESEYEETNIKHGKIA